MSRRGAQVTIVGGAVVMAALVVAALGQPVPLLSRPLDAQTFTPLPTLTSLPPSATPPRPTSTSTSTPFDPSPVLVTLVQIVLVLAALVVLVVLAQLVRSLLRRRPHLELHEEPDFAIPLVPTELLEEARDRLRDLESGEPRNAIVAAWLGLETSAAATGLPRLTAETSTEYTERVIGVWPVDSARLGDLAALYREARFSVHDLGESHRDRAIADLRVLIADLEQVASRQAAERGASAAAREESS
ncbi:hypothetical protein ASE25_20005 [Terrabacter sp. Root85]|uniref:DUF4129 domain-containing protein n=1 Tax=Terrabacter sp. Root85 TaxID=1736603 RepID=UPI0006F79B35|nr:DUF4129 domain-containing protein [Terrabacter sp. Root85]KRC85319.1 hypothetical protein ASE25_20005 [Terrabacter sp. Root85]